MLIYPYPIVGRNCFLSMLISAKSKGLGHAICPLPLPYMSTELDYPVLPDVSGIFEFKILRVVLRVNKLTGTVLQCTKW